VSLRWIASAAWRVEARVKLDALLVSFVVPAYNEANFLRRTLPAIREHVPAPWRSEIIVIDNQSSDDTAAVARSAGADTVLTLGGTVAALRNRGAAESRGRILVFLDADVFLTKEWAFAFPGVIADLEVRPRQVTGSWVCVPDAPTFIERSWFAPQQGGVHSHINSGHMIMFREAFNELHGFDERLRTGEDVELSRRAVERGFAIEDRAVLKAIHEGFPKTLWAFARREYWHGLGYYSSWSSFRGSRVTQIAQLIFLSLLCALVTAIWGQSPAPAALWALATGGLLMVLSARLFRAEGPWRVLTNAGLYFVYMLARFLSLFGAWGWLPTRVSRTAVRTA
jgi:glycosyltransferase involved in cell wall biosynthesis